MDLLPFMELVMSVIRIFLIFLNFEHSLLPLIFLYVYIIHASSSKIFCEFERRDRQ